MLIQKLQKLQFVYTGMEGQSRDRRISTYKNRRKEGAPVL